jgi:hypothetical protein
MEAMIRLSENEREIMGRRGREKVIKQFDESIIIKKYHRSIEEVLSS